VGNGKNILVVLLFGLLCNTAQAMEQNSEFYDEKYEMSFLMQAIEKKEHDASEEELKIVEQKNNKIKPVNNYLCSRKNCMFACSHENRIIKHREMHRLQDVLPHMTMYHCKSCDYLTDTQKNMNDHNKSHDDKKQFRCEVCNLWFKTITSRNRHERESLIHKQNSKKRPLLVLTNGR
jgi:rubredoxin